MSSEEGRNGKTKERGNRWSAVQCGKGEREGKRVKKSEVRIGRNISV